MWETGLGSREVHRCWAMGKSRQLRQMSSRDAQPDSDIWRLKTGFDLNAEIQH